MTRNSEMMTKILCIRQDQSENLKPIEKFKTYIDLQANGKIINKKIYTFGFMI